MMMNETIEFMFMLLHSLCGIVSIADVIFVTIFVFVASLFRFVLLKSTKYGLLMLMKLLKLFVYIILVLFVCVASKRRSPNLTIYYKYK